jgi:hypothetical protein
MRTSNLTSPFWSEDYNLSLISTSPYSPDLEQHELPLFQYSYFSEEKISLLITIKEKLQTQFWNSKILIAWMLQTIPQSLESLYQVTRELL